MKNKRLISLILTFLCPIFMLAQNVSVVGKTNIPNALVRLLTYDEMLTCMQTKVAETQSDKDGHFTLNADIKDITPAQIAVNLERIDIILSPNGKYDFEITIPESKDGSYFDKKQPILKINSIDDNGLYSQFVAAQSFIDDFIYYNFDMIYHERRISLLDTLDNQLVKNIGEIKNDYIKNLIKYRKASILMALNPAKTKTEYFDNQDVLYFQAAYMDVLKELFKSGGRDDDFLSRNWQIAEIVDMMNLKKSYYSNPQNKDQIMSSLEKIEKSSKSLGNRVIAKNIAKQLNDLSYDSKAPFFSLKDKNGNITQLSDYQDNMVVIQFVDHFTSLLEHEFSTLNEFQKQWNDTVQVVTIATKESFDEYVKLFENQGYKWKLLNLGEELLLLEDYHIRTYPAYIILKKKNRIGMAPAPDPDRLLDRHVRRISKYL